MGEQRTGEHRPIQTSAVIVLNGSKRPITRPPSPPTPSVMPADTSAPFAEPPEPFHLQYKPTATTTPYSEPPPPAATSHDAEDDDDDDDDDEGRQESRLRSGLHVLNTEALALAHLTQLYSTCAAARHSFHRAVSAVTRQAATGGKLVLLGVGKSGLICRKLAATFQSLGVRAAFLHPTEALHGDLGLLAPAHDTLLFLTYSGATPELLALLPHLDAAMPAVLLTSHTAAGACALARQRPGAILLPAPVHEPERASFGVPAPTSSTTAALALGDALALTAAREMHPDVAAAFSRNHPGGAIGLASACAAKQKKKVLVPPRAATLRELAVAWDDMPDAGRGGGATAASLLRAAYASRSGWVRVGEAVAAPRRLRALRDEDLPGPPPGGLLVSSHDLLAMSAETTVRQARDILRGTGEGAAAGSSSSSSGGGGMDDDDEADGATAVIAVTEGGRICGVLEVAQVLEHRD